MPAFPWATFNAPDPAQQYLVMASRLPLRSYWKIPAFLRLTFAVRGQLTHAEGLVGYSLLAEPLSKTFWTLSAWRDRASLDAFARALPHADVIRALRPQMEPTTFLTWSVAGRDLPISWTEAKSRLLAAPLAQPRAR